MKYTLIVFVILLQTFETLAARTGSPSNIDLMCREKAKEMAAQTYKTCIVENKTAKLDAIKKKYEERLKAMKSQYEAELQAMGAKASKPAETNSTPYSEDQIEANESEMDIPEPIPVQ